MRSLNRHRATTTSVLILMLGIVLLLGAFSDQASAVFERFIKRVLVVNPPDRPALIRDVDAPAFQPFQATVRVRIPPGGDFSPGVMLDPLPAGKRLVIEYVSVFTETQIPNFIGIAGVIKTTLDGDGDGVFHTACVATTLNVNRMPGDASLIPFSPSNAVCGQTTRLYADQVEVFARRPFTPPGEAIVQIRISGHLVNVA